MTVTTIVLTGPESSGKTTLAAELSRQFNTPWVPEFARKYVAALDRPYEEPDLLEIAKGQVALEQKVLGQVEKGPVFLDTSLEVIEIWSAYRFGTCHPWIREQIEQRPHNLYILCSPDIPWTPDPLRENPHDRNDLFQLYKKLFLRRNLNFVELDGQYETRVQKAVEHVKSYLTDIHPADA